MKRKFHDKENNVQNLACKEAIIKLKELVDSARICMLIYTRIESQCQAAQGLRRMWKKMVKCIFLL